MSIQNSINAMLSSIGEGVFRLNHVKNQKEEIKTQVEALKNKELNAQASAQRQEERHKSYLDFMKSKTDLNNAKTMSIQAQMAERARQSKDAAIQAKQERMRKKGDA